MRGVNDCVIRLMLDTMYWSGLHRAMAPKTAGVGIIFMLHRVRPSVPKGVFAPNAALEVDPEFLDRVLTLVKRRGFDVVGMDEAAKRLSSGSRERFAAFTFDDGYADNFEIALPLFDMHKAPFAVYVTTGMMDGTADIWWLVLEESIARSDSIRVRIGGEDLSLPTRTAPEMQAAWDRVYWPLRDLAVGERQEAINALADAAGVSIAGVCASVSAGWPRLREAANNPLLTIGAHTLTHLPLASLADEEARAEIVESKRRIETEIGKPVRHFAYPFGDRDSAGRRDFRLAREAGFDTAVTTRRGPLFEGHADHLHALPRVSLNGHFQATRYVSVFLSGAPFALWNKGRQLDVE